MEEELKPITDFDGKVYTIEEALQRHNGFLWTVAKKYQASGKEYGLGTDDLNSIAKMGLVKAFKKFDSGAGVKFITYMSRCAENEVLMALRNGATATGKWGLARHRAKVFYEKFPEQQPTIEKIIEATGCDYNGAVKVIDYMVRRHGQSLDAEMSVHNGEDNITFGDMVGKNADYTRIHISEYFEVLDTRERQIVDLMMEDVQQHEIGKRLGVSQSYVSRLIGRIKFKMEKVQRGERVMKRQNNDTQYKKAIIEEARNLLRSGLTISQVVKATGMPQASVYYYNGQVELEKKKANATAKPQAPKKDLPKPKAVTPDEVAQAKPVKETETLREKHVIHAGKLKDNPIANLPAIIEDLRKQLTTAQNEAKSHKAELDNAQKIVLSYKEKEESRKKLIEKQGDHIVELKTNVNTLIAQELDSMKKLNELEERHKKALKREDAKVKEAADLQVRWEKAQALIEKQFAELETANEAVLVADQRVEEAHAKIAKLEAKLEDYNKPCDLVEEKEPDLRVKYFKTDWERTARENGRIITELHHKVEELKAIAKKAVNLL